MAAAQQQQPINYSNYPLKDIPQPHDHDVLCGRGGGTNNHIGNSHWRMLVAANKQLYITLPKRQKMLLSRSVVNAVRSQNPPGRFLQKDSKSKLWFDVGDQRAQEKTSQALREGAPDIRKKVAATTAASSKEQNPATATVPVTKPTTSTSNSNSTSTSNSNNFEPVANVKKEKRPMDAAATPASTEQQPTRTSLAPGSADSSSSYPLSSATIGGRRMMQPTPELEHYSNGHGVTNRSDGNNNNYMQQQQQQQQEPNNNMYGSVSANNNGIYSNMTLNEQGIMVQNDMGGSEGTRIYNNNQNHSYQQQQQQYQQQQQQQQQQHTINYQQQQDQYQQQYHGGLNNNNNSSAAMPTFDDYVSAPPPEELETQGLSFGSIAMTDAEMNRLQQYSAININKQNQQQYQHQQQSRHSLSNSNYYDNNNNNNHNNYNNTAAALPVGDTLEPTGISMGDVSMMSAGTNFQMKLEDIGTSFGTMMSYNTLHPDMVDGGLMEAVGTSFGSLSLDMTGNNRDKLYKTLEIAASGPEVPPMLFHPQEKKSSGNLLDCSDTESENSNSNDKHQLTKQKSQAAWEMMKTSLQQQTSKGNSVGSQDLMPPPPRGNFGLSSSQQQQQQQQRNITTASSASASGLGNPTFDNIEIALPTTTMESNFSTLSAWSAVDDDDFNHDPEPSSDSHPGLIVKGKIENSDYSGVDDTDDFVAPLPLPPPQLTKSDSF